MVNKTYREKRIELYYLFKGITNSPIGILINNNQVFDSNVNTLLQKASDFLKNNIEETGFIDVPTVGQRFNYSFVLDNATPSSVSAIPL